MLKNKRRGQVSMLFALLIPIFLLFVGLALDLGWYYLNVSRLQNAADAAAVAGAQTLISDVETFNSFKGVALVDKYPTGKSYEYFADSNSEKQEIDDIKYTVENYVNKNLSSMKEASLVDAWTKSPIETNSGLYEKDDNYYYVVQLKEEIRHFFLPGWFDDMSAPVTAVAMLSKDASRPDPFNGKDSSGENDSIFDGIFGDGNGSGFSFPSKVFSDEAPVFEFDDPIVDDEVDFSLLFAANTNTIVGNWEVQNAYKSLTNKNFVDPDTGEPITEFEARFGYAVYEEKWNHFQDLYHHYAAGNFFRTQKVTVLDDVIDIDGDKLADSYGTKSSVVATRASSNKGGLPYIKEVLDSINIDFRPEVTLSGKWLSQDWDLSEGFDGVSFSPSASSKISETWDKTGGFSDADIKKLRIHTTINFDGDSRGDFDELYLTRDDSYREEDENGDLVADTLWVRIESEPMLRYPDAATGFLKSNITNGTGVTGLNSVNQIIINANSSNIEEKYRPYIIFYDGPERYDTKTSIRDSKPVILNLNIPFRAILYMPNSPVIVMGSAKDEFRGFIVAKKYMRLRTEDEFELYYRRYYKEKDRATELKKVYYNNGETTSEIIDSGYWEDVYRLKNPANDEEKNKKYFYVPSYKTESDIEMFVDEYGDIAVAELNNAPKKIGSYDNFGRTDFSTHSYKVFKTLADNMLLSGVKFDYEK